MRTLTLLCAVAFAACSAPPEPGEPTPTFFTDLKPILEAKCTQCHQAGGIGPMRLDDYATAKAHAASIAAAVESGTMPPFLVKHDGTCGDFHAEQTLTDAERATILKWASSGAAEGTHQHFEAPPPPQLEGARELRTPVFSPEVQGGPLAAFDEYRCFALPHGVDHDAFLTGYEVLPGDARVIHHVIGFLIDPAKMSNDGMRTNGAVLQELDEETPDRAGWPCFGFADDRGLVRVDAAPVDWAPGQGIVEYPSGMGVPLDREHLFVVQVHYNLADPATHGTSDSTRVRLRTADSVERKLVFLLPDGLLQTLFGPNPMPAQLPPGAASTKFTWTMTAADLGLGPLPFADVMAVMPHMHGRGRTLELRYDDTCGARVDDWDFHWQRMYFYREGSIPRLTSSTSLKVTCDYDTSADTSPVSPGWGTRNEMCLVVLMLALPPGI